MTITEEIVYKALGNVQEPDLKKDLVTLGMVQNVKIGVNQINFTIVLTTPACPLKEKIRKDCVDAIHNLIDSSINVNIDFTSNVTSTRSNTPLLPDVKNIIAIASGKGGVGKSTVTANLAVALQRSGAKVGIIDADIFGPSIPTMFGMENTQPFIEKREDKNYIIPVIQYGVKLISIGFLTPPDQAVVWRGPMASTALKQFVTDVAWGELDYLLVDLPPGTSDIHITLVDALPVTGAVVVTTPQKVSIIDAVKAIAMFRQSRIKVPILGIVENMAYFTPYQHPNEQYFLFGKDGGKLLADQMQIPLLGQIPIVQDIMKAGDEGRPAIIGANEIVSTAFKNLAEEVARQVAIRNANLDASIPVGVGVYN